jgi:hypothetical protein
MSLSHLTPETRRLIRSLKPFDIILVTWEDAYTVIRDATLEDAAAMGGREMYMRDTLGYTVRADNEYIILAGTDDRDAAKTSNEVGDLTVLCTGFVRDVQLLRRDR